ncbi:MAG TPA: D-alanyl-D-alanine carboxypeptidase family protein [Luteitalea sp.]|nr:D-alanyl-D-alanine carboxypeptidase family protein [Luteitalea sp.]
MSGHVPVHAIACRSAVAAIAIVTVALLASVSGTRAGHALVAATWSKASSTEKTQRIHKRAAAGRPRVGPRRVASWATFASPSAFGAADGAITDGVTPFDGRVSGVARLSAPLRDALRRAARDAARDGVVLVVNSGWRSAAYQDHLYLDAVSHHASEEEAARWVATADTSPHVRGEAVDVGPSRATAWLARHGAEYGLCRIYRNEPWHFELRRDALDGGCPSMFADPSHDPRMQR